MLKREDDVLPALLERQQQHPKEEPSDELDFHLGS